MQGYGLKIKNKLNNDFFDYMILVPSKVLDASAAIVHPLSETDAISCLLMIE